MARRRARGRASRQRTSGLATTGRSGLTGAGLDATVVPRMLVGAVNGVEIVTVGALQFARDVLLSAVSGAADVGAEALSATTAGARGVVSSTSRMIGEIAGTAESTFREAVQHARHSRPGTARVVLRRPAARMAGREDERSAAVSTAAATRSRRRSKRPPRVARPARPAVAA